MNLVEREITLLSTIKRWGVIRTLQTQSVADHSFNVAMYVDRVMSRNETFTCEEIAEAVRYALWHDMSECFMSDIPTYVKARWNESHLVEHKGMASRFGFLRRPESPQAPVVDIIKFCDVLESHLFLALDSQLGNLGLEKVKKKIYTELKTRYDKMVRHEFWDGHRETMWEDLKSTTRHFESGSDVNGLSDHE